MFIQTLIVCVFCVNLCCAEVYRTLNDTEKLIANYCMDNKDPMIPSTYSCEDSHQAEISNLHSTVIQMLSKVDSAYKPSDSLYPTFPALSSGIFNILSSTIYSIEYLPRYSVFNTLIGSRVGCWRSHPDDTNEYIAMGSSVPFLFEKIVTAGSGSLNMWVTSFKLYYTLDNDAWVQYGGTFQSNKDDNTIFELILNPFVARAIRIYPMGFYSGIAMRVEVYVSKHDYKAQALKGRSFSAIEYGYNVALSNIMGDFYGYYNLNLNYYYSLTHICMSSIKSGEWIKVTSGYLMKWENLIIHSFAQSELLISYIHIHYSIDGVNWTYFGIYYSFYSNSNYYYIQLNFYAILIRVTFKCDNSDWCYLKLQVKASEA